MIQHQLDDGVRLEGTEVEQLEEVPDSVAQTAQYSPGLGSRESVSPVRVRHEDLQVSQELK